MSRKKIVAGNWKMNMSLEQSQALITEIRGIVRDESAHRCKVILFPTYIALQAASRLLEGTEIAYGAQNCHQEDSGAFTGEISASIIRSTGAEYVIIGHSERRQYFAESDELLLKKTRAVLQQEMVAIFCIGETLEQREDGSFFQVLENQLKRGLFALSAKQMEHIVIAYEPVWAIGTGQTASPEQAQEIHAFIRKLLVEKYGPEIAESTSILYGGSVKPDNAKEIFSKPDIDGGLIGGASLKARDFIEIVKAN